MDISNFYIIILLNSSQDDLLVDPKMISSTKILHINKFLSIGLVKRVGSAFPTLKPLVRRKSLWHSYHALGGLFEPIKRLWELINMWRILTIFKVGRLLNIYLFLVRSIEEGTLHVAEPPKLLGPHAPILVSKTLDGYASAPDNLTGSVPVSQGPRINHLQPGPQD
jgi:hypothetical protein